MSKTKQYVLDSGIKKSTDFLDLFNNFLRFFEDIKVQSTFFIDGHDRESR